MLCSDAAGSTLPSVPNSLERFAWKLDAMLAPWGIGGCYPLVCTIKLAKSCITVTKTKI